MYILYTDLAIELECIQITKSRQFFDHLVNLTMECKYILTINRKIHDMQNIRMSYQRVYNLKFKLNTKKPLQ